MRNTILLFFVFFSVAALSQISTISGTDSSYAGQKLAFKMQFNPFTNNDSVLCEVVADKNGSFKAEINLAEIREVYIDAGINKLYLFVVPGNNYSVILPPFEKKTNADRLNPFFLPVEIHLATSEHSEDELNVRIRMFEDAYVPYYNKHLNMVFSDKEFKQLDKDILQIDKPFQKSNDKFFNQYREYKYAMLRFLAMQNKSKVTSDEFLKGKPFLYNNPAYLDLFNMVFENYFSYFSRADENKKLSKAISEMKTYESLRNVLAQDGVIQPEELLNMVILKGLYEEFYDDNYSRSDLLSILDSFINTVEDQTQVLIAEKVRKKVTKLLRGYEPPDFSLYDSDSNLYSLKSFSGKHVYLNFCACFSYSCLNEFAMLKTLYEKHSQYLQIVTIIIDEDVEVMKDFIQKSGYSWVFLHFDNQPEILQQYDIRALPTYFLIDQEGKLVMSPAPSPADEFEARLFKELRAKGVL
ncbi:MAG: TlpA family protein disulfide reductase [Bacteroidales bacterium]|nr:TlpA family protein disulfide reductase [Bacteroidales bacterium]MBN2818231.1 TlpA family protein disulfide reductase [Bacteroidales bacterium]